MQNVGESERTEWRKLTGLKHNRAARSYRRADFGGDLIQRPIPGCDQPRHTNGLARNGGSATHLSKFIASQIIPGNLQMSQGQRYMSGSGIIDRRAHFGRQDLS